MNEKKYSNQAITEYLLGSLPEVEAELFDELSITDDEFAAAIKSVENDLVDSYVRGELKGARLETFKSYYLASPARREKVSFAQALQGFTEKIIAHTNEESSVITELKPKQSDNGFFSAINIFASPHLVWQWGFAAAAVVLIILGGWLWLENARLSRQANETEVKRDEQMRREQELQNQLANERSANSETHKELARASEERERLVQELEKAQTQKQQRIIEQARPPKAPSSAAAGVTPPMISIASFVLLPPVRGGSSSIQSLSIPARTSRVAVKLQLESDDYTAYRVALVDQSDNKNLWQSGKTKARTKGENKTLNIQFPAKLLKPQIYSLVVSGINADGKVEIISDYPFRAVIK